jgi:hypothetical protein
VGRGVGRRRGRLSETRRLVLRRLSRNVEFRAKFGNFEFEPACLVNLDRHIWCEGIFPMLQNDIAVFHAFAWDPAKAEYEDWRGMGTRAAIAERGFKAQGPVHYCPKEWLKDRWLDKPKGR